jgi:hypothetical protein
MWSPAGAASRFADAARKAFSAAGATTAAEMDTLGLGDLAISYLDIFGR